MTVNLRAARTWALYAIAALVAAASLVSFLESYRGLYYWAHRHGLTGIWAAGFPAQIDVFIAVGELALFAALVDRWSTRSRVFPWTVILAGLAVSVAGNVGHVTSHAFTSRATAAVPPLAAAAALAVGLGVLKRVVGAHHKAVVPPARTTPEPVSEPSDVSPAPVSEPADPPGTDTPVQPVPGDAQSAAAAAYAASVAASNPISQRQLMTRFGLTRSQVTKIRQTVAVGANGHGDVHDLNPNQSGRNE